MAVQTSYPVTMTAAIEGALCDDAPHDVFPAYSEEASAEIPFGTAVKRGTNANGALQPTAETDLILGIVLHDNSYTRGTSTSQLGTTGLRPGVAMNVLRKGRIWVRPAGAVVAGVSRLWVRAVAGGGERLGSIEDADDSTDTVDCTAMGTFLDTVSAGELCRLEVDFSREAT